MGIRDRLRSQDDSYWSQYEESRTDRIKKRFTGSGWDDDGTARRVATRGAKAAKERLDNVDKRRIVEALRQSGSGGSPRPSRGTADEREMAQRAEEAATAGAIVDATFDGVTAPEETGFFAMGRRSDGANVDSAGGDNQPRVDDLVYGAGVPGQDSMGAGFDVGVGLGSVGEDDDQEESNGEDSGMFEFDDPFGVGGGF
ncbi:hypothetical protein [Haloferax sp. KTX1]|uniref:hypothetical protein n=1 Tax=Haloferax sp. KTX1 TaxID=2600597 RepID=UPI0011DDAFE8|nr:hypothetical protein [Haloferax sp. KTX1]